MITSRSNETIKAVARLVSRRSDEYLVLEGPHLLAEALTAGLELELVLADSKSLAHDPDLIQLLPRLSTPPTEVATGLLDPLADADSPRGVLTVAVRPRLTWPQPVRRALYLDGVQDPGNLGALARVLEAAGGNALLLGPGCAHPHHPRALRASAGSLLRIPWQRDLEVAAAAELTGAATWWGLAGEASASLWELATPTSEGLVLALGAEGRGLAEATRQHCRQLVSIPLAAPVESLNVATAAAVALFELTRRG